MIERARLADGYAISRIVKGGWHLAGDHGAIDPEQALRDMARFVDAGITTFDCADIYTGVEEMIGAFRRRFPEHAARAQIHTKFVPDLSALATLGPGDVERIVDRSRDRLGVERIDLVQFHWWDYATPRFVETALELERLRRDGKIAHLGVTNFDVAHLSQILDAGVRITAHQLQYSLLDRRPDHGMVELCRRHDVALLCYGTVAGGFISRRWLGVPPPEAPANRSLIKYRLIIEDFGGWERFQRLLEALAAVADKHGVDLATVATRAVLDRPGVAAAIVGATSTAHLAAHARIATLTLDPEDLDRLAAVGGPPGPAGDVYALERDRHGPHGRIMKYELNKA